MIYTRWCVLVHTLGRMSDGRDKDADVKNTEQIYGHLVSIARKGMDTKYTNTMCLFVYLAKRHQRLMFYINLN